MQVGMNIQRRVSSGDFADSKTNILKLRAHTYTEPLLWLFSQNQYALWHHDFYWFPALWKGDINVEDYEWK